MDFFENHKAIYKISSFHSFNPAFYIIDVWMRYLETFCFTINLFYREIFVLIIRIYSAIFCSKHFHMTSNISFFILITDLFLKLFSKLEIELSLISNICTFISKISKTHRKEWHSLKLVKFAFSGQGWSSLWREKAEARGTRA